MKNNRRDFLIKTGAALVGLPLMVQAAETQQPARDELKESIIELIKLYREGDSKQRQRILKGLKQAPFSPSARNYFDNLSKALVGDFGL